MADKPSKKRRIRASSETVRERVEKKTNAPEKKPRKIKRAGTAVARPFKAAHRIGKKEYYLPLPDNRAGIFLNKRRSAAPKFFVEAWQELRQVVWPTRRETIKLTFAVFIFAIVFGLLVTVVDYGLDKLFRKVILKV